MSFSDIGKEFDKDLIEKIGISREARIVTYELSDEEFKKILKFGGANESLIVN